MTQHPSAKTDHGAAAVPEPESNSGQFQNCFLIGTHGGQEVIPFRLAVVVSMNWGLSVTDDLRSIEN